LDLELASLIVDDAWTMYLVPLVPALAFGGWLFGGKEGITDNANAGSPYRRPRSAPLFVITFDEVYWIDADRGILDLPFIVVSIR
jgi:hypothetical protein